MRKKKLRKPRSRYVQRLFGVVVTADDLKRAIAAVHALPPESRSTREARTIALAREFLGPPGECWGTGTGDEIDESARGVMDKLSGIQFRLEALARLHDHRNFKGWSMPSDVEEMIYIREEVLEAAAAAPLYEDRQRPAFDPDSFFTLVLDATEHQGTS